MGGRRGGVFEEDGGRRGREKGVGKGGGGGEGEGEGGGGEVEIVEVGE